MIGLQRENSVIDLPRRLLVNIHDGGLEGTADAFFRMVGAEFWHRLGNGVDVMREDWDNLIILDALRADVCRQYSPEDWTVKTINSPATHSWSFMKQSYAGRKLHDTVMISANPFVNDLPASTFHAVHYVQKADGSVPDPETVTEAALEAIVTYPSKRLIIHYMQPHAPYLHHDDPSPRYPFDRARATGDLETLRSDYVQNFLAVQSSVIDLLPRMSGLSVLTADHGEALGESYRGLRRFEHGHAIPEVYRVPWVEFTNGERPSIKPEPPIPETNIDEEQREKQLAALGYRA